MKKFFLIAGLCVLPVLGACNNTTSIQTETVETQIAKNWVDTEINHWKELGLNIIYDKDNEDKVINENTQERYERCKNLSEEAQEAVKAYFGKDNKLLEINQKFMSDKKCENMSLQNSQALEALAYDETYTGVYVAVIVEVDGEIKETLFEVAFNGSEIEDFRQRDTNLDGTGEPEIFSPDEAHYGLFNGRIRKIDRG